MKLRKIEHEDTGLLVKWRNANAAYFPPRLNPLTEEEHRSWFYNTYRYDPADHMYIVEVGGAPVGTIGINVSTHEIQRVMRGEKGVAPGIMGEALDKLVETYSHGDSWFWLKGLETNPHAIAFYKKHYFRKFNNYGGTSDNGWVHMEREIS